MLLSEVTTMPPAYAYAQQMPVGPGLRRTLRASILHYTNIIYYTMLYYNIL